mmetsp:Transcript_4613/g.5050  ORF Transcript_4613/g.5050 Transcript_4613/m.5050 type:complete len:95 (+) Transcript_4613:61-345(+)|eukprot:CAMPEP_0173153782 /NCGR_PEP_ID=MMETSP1105-20130129/13062_1 /TAXON_ID=2985 /ORGANISM="Ochromonas sp., Strain BG-1" /LENGTH=94 /DNA_ID=CAMNT_0014069777 /DNA_START=61 /DNA_END=345 /DNA_ORIENTATION=+
MSDHSNVLKTTPTDPIHYPATNQAHYCWQKYNEFVLCIRKNNGDETPCNVKRQQALSICPLEWVENWDGQRQKGNFLGVQEHGKVAPDHGSHKH